MLHFIRPLSTALTIALMAGVPAYGQEGLDDALGGFDGGEFDGGGDFDQPAPPTPPPAIPRAAPSPWSLSGAFTFSAAYDYTQNAPQTGEYDKRGLSRVRPKVALQLKGNFPNQLPRPVRIVSELTIRDEQVYAIRGRDDYPEPVKNSFERDLNIGELYANVQFNDAFEVTAGRQIVVWGSAENLRVVDILNPLDQREIGMVDIEDLRLPVAMVRADYVSGPWTTTVMAIPEIRLNKTAPARSAFDASNGAPPPQDTPADDLANMEFAARVQGNFSGWDVALQAANVFNDGAHKETVQGVTRLRHARVNMVGVSADMAVGNWLFKGEAATINGLKTLAVPNRDFTRSDVLLGLEVSTIADLSISAEVVNRHLYGWDATLKAEGLRQDTQEYALRISGDYLRDRLHLSALMSRLSPLARGGGFSRASVAYDLQDALTITGGITLYRGGTRAPFKGLGDNDRVFLEIKKSF